MGKRTDRRPRIRMAREVVSLASEASEQSDQSRRFVLRTGARFFTTLRFVQNDRGEGEGDVVMRLAYPASAPGHPQGVAPTMWVGRTARCLVR